MSRVTLLGSFPSENVDGFIASTARISTDSRQTDVRGLIRYLFRHSHLSPFEFANFTFEIEAPIFVKNHVVRHRSAKFNERSLRYTTYKEDFFRPSQHEGAIRFCLTENQQEPSRDYSGDNLREIYEKNKKLNNRQSSIVLPNEEVKNDFLRIEQKIENLFEEYQLLLNKGIAPEVARFCLPLATMTKFRICFDLRNLLNFLNLRLDSGAQKETRDIAEQMYQLIKPLAPETLSVWEEYEYNALKLTLLKDNVSISERNEMKLKFDIIDNISK